MRRPILMVVSLAIVICATALGFALRAAWRSEPTARVLAVEVGDRELAFIQSATSFVSWENLVDGAKRVKLDGVTVDDSAAFPDDTTRTPQLAIRMAGQPGRLVVRWYKLSGGVRVGDWIAALARRGNPPLAVVGGDSSNRAIELAEALAQKREWGGPSPLLLITQATATSYFPAGKEIKLIDIYPRRTFRFCLTNVQMAEAVLDFVRRWPDDLRPTRAMVPVAATGFAAASPFAAVAALLADAAGPIPKAFAFHWADSAYSEDLFNEFRELLRRPADPTFYGPPEELHAREIAYSVGGFDWPNRHEAEAVKALAEELAGRRQPGQRSLLVLPIGTTQARRVLKSLCESSPLVGQYLVAVSGDSIGLNAMYRDAEFAWDARRMPVPLIAFAHADPIDWGADFRSGAYPSSTEDTVRNADLLGVLLPAAFASDEPPPDADRLAERLREMVPPFFDGAGNRSDAAPGGAYIIWLHPVFDTDNVTGATTFVRAELRFFYRRADHPLPWKRYGPTLIPGTSNGQ